MTKCWYLLNLSGGYIRVCYSISPTFLLCMLRCLKMKNFNSTIITQEVVWLDAVYGDTFLPSKATCYAAVTQLSYNWECWLAYSKGHSCHPRIKKQIANLGIEVGWSLLNPGRDLQSRRTDPFVDLGNKTGPAQLGWKQRLGLQPGDWLELAQWWKMPTWHCLQYAGLELILFLVNISDSIPPTLFWGPNIQHLFSLQLPLVQM